MFNRTIVKKNSYYDSVTLMSLGNKIKGKENVNEVVVVMATDMNKEILRRVGLATVETENAGVNDLIIGVQAINEEDGQRAFEAVEENLTKKNDDYDATIKQEYKTVRHAIKDNSALNMAVISVPGRYAAREARTALNNGMNVMMFSDNVSIDDERSLKELAVSKGLLMMGADCGTAIINHVGLCFANCIRRGNIGMVGASGTGMQEVLVQIDHLGGGITQAIGTGGRDLTREIGGTMMTFGIKALAADPKTEVIVLVSKPPEQSVLNSIFMLLEEIKKPVVVCFLDGEEKQNHGGHIHTCANLLDAAKLAVKLAGVRSCDYVQKTTTLEDQKTVVCASKKVLTVGQKNLRGLFCGGTLCAEALSVLRSRLGKIKSNVSHRRDEEMCGSDECEGNVLLDMGDDYFTNGRPHPMIEPSLRNASIEAQGFDKTVGVVLLDFEIGYGSHEDPVGVTLPAIRKAMDNAALDGRKLYFVTYVCGTEDDEQGLTEQQEKLTAVGAIVCNSNFEAANLAADILE
ncbi:MAG: acyl-CoA synthetase FdrA [Christensenellaceae bacterium]